MADGGRRAAQSFQSPRAKRLFELPGGTYHLDANFADYDVAADGRFIAARRNRTTTAEVQVVLNWTELLGTALGQR